MKRLGNLFEELVSIDNLEYAHKKASKGKAHYREVKWVNENKEEALDALRKSLIEGTFKTSTYVVSEEIKGNKLRVIHKLPYYPDRIVQHAIANVCKDFWIKSFIRDTFQSIPGRGTLDCFKRIKRAIQKDKPTYALKIDIKQFYPSLQNKHLLKPHIFRIKCKDTFALISGIIKSLPGLPLGNHISQYAGNLILSPIDWYCKQSLGIKYYYRYCDDILIMSDDKQELLFWKKTIQSKLREVDLETKPFVNIIDLRYNLLDFVGYRMNHNTITLRPRLVRSFIKSCRKGSSKSLPSYYGWLKHSNSKSLWYTNTGKNKWKLL